MTQIEHPQRRGSGRTTRQMMEAPTGAVFVWCNDGTRWAEAHARDLGRGDLIIIGPAELESRRMDRLRGIEFPAVVVDHAVRDLGLTSEQWVGYQFLLAQVRP